MECGAHQSPYIQHRHTSSDRTLSCYTHDGVDAKGILVWGTEYGISTDGHKPSKEVIAIKARDRWVETRELHRKLHETSCWNGSAKVKPFLLLVFGIVLTAAQLNHVTVASLLAAN